jgi:hypothetical protein
LQGHKIVKAIRFELANSGTPKANIINNALASGFWNRFIVMPLLLGFW